MSFTVHSDNLNQFLLWIPSTICVKKKKKKKKEALFTSGDSRLTQKGDLLFKIPRWLIVTAHRK